MCDGSGRGVEVLKSWDPFNEALNRPCTPPGVGRSGGRVNTYLTATHNELKLNLRDLYSRQPSRYLF